MRVLNVRKFVFVHLSNMNSKSDHHNNYSVNNKIRPLVAEEMCYGYFFMQNNIKYFTTN